MSTVDLPQFSISTRTARAATVVTICGELDLATAPVVDEYLGRALEREDRRLVLNCSKLTFIDCYGLRPLVRAHDALAPYGGEILLREPNRMFRRLLELTYLDQAFRIF